MSLTATQRGQIRLYIGWSARFYQTDSRLEQAMNGMDTRPEETLLILSELTRLIAVDAKLDDAANRFKAHKVGSIELQGDMELGLLRSQGRQAAGRMASLLGVEVRNDVFAGAGPRAYATAGGLMPSDAGGGNIVPHG